MLSSQEKTLNALDKVSLQGVDFKAYLEGRAEAEESIIPADHFIEALHDKVLGKTSDVGATLPWSYTHDKFRLRPGEVTLWFGINGHKKSMVTGFVAVDLMAQGHKVAIASLEMSPVATLGRMMPQAHGKHCYTTQQADNFISWCEDKLWIYDKRGTIKQDAIIGAIYYCSEQLGVNHFFVDSLMKCVKGEEDYSGQKLFVDALCSAALETKTHIHLIHHSKKLQDPKAVPGKFDAKGSGSIMDQVDNSVVVYQIPEESKDEMRRQREYKGEPPDHCLKFPKQRNGINGWEGQVVTWFDKDTLQFIGKEDKVKQYIN